MQTDNFILCLLLYYFTTKLWKALVTVALKREKYFITYDIGLVLRYVSYKK